MYDGDDVVLSFDGAGSLTHRYLHGDAVDQAFASEDALGEVLWALTDYQGTVRGIADYDVPTDTLTFVDHRQFDSFGNITSESNPSVDFRYAYTGRYFDADTGLQYNRARWYDPTVARFVSEDPIGFNAGDSNLSRYVGNSPGNATDPSGLHPPTDWLGPRVTTFKVGGTKKGFFTGAKYTYSVFPVWLRTRWRKLTSEERDRALQYGCGGVASIRADHPHSGTVHLKKGARAFTDYNEAVDALSDMQKKGKALLVAVQTDVGLYSTPPDGKPAKHFPARSSEFDPRLINIPGARVRNFASLVRTRTKPAWEWANHAAQCHDYYSDPMYIVRNKTLPRIKYTFYVVIPNSRDNSPLFYSTEFSKENRPPGS